MKKIITKERRKDKSLDDLRKELLLRTPIETVTK
jgi:hypothetical protein